MLVMLMSVQGEGGRLLLRLQHYPPRPHLLLSLSTLHKLHQPPPRQWQQEPRLWRKQQ